jgi:hypothetical protein
MESSGGHLFSLYLYIHTFCMSLGGRIPAREGVLETGSNFWKGLKGWRVTRQSLVIGESGGAGEGKQKKGLRRLNISRNAKKKFNIKQCLPMSAVKTRHDSKGERGKAPF